jgi:hypothetical protein
MGTGRFKELIHVRRRARMKRRTERYFRSTDGYETLADAAAIDDWATLLGVMLAQPDADTAID